MLNNISEIGIGEQPQKAPSKFGHYKIPPPRRVSRYSSSDIRLHYPKLVLRSFSGAYINIVCGVTTLDKDLGSSCTSHLHTALLRNLQKIISFPTKKINVFGIVFQLVFNLKLMWLLFFIKKLNSVARQPMLGQGLLCQSQLTRPRALGCEAYVPVRWSTLRGTPSV